MPRTVASNTFEEKLLNNVHQYGWHCNSVSGNDETPSFTYTIGLFASYGHPELIIFGFGSKFAHSIVSYVADAAAQGNPLNLSIPSPDLLENYLCLFVQVPEPLAREYALSANWFYQDESVPFYQIVWPSVAGHFPWHPEADKDFVSSQPVLGVPPDSV